jgi:hypothetical protein
MTKPSLTQLRDDVLALKDSHTATDTKLTLAETSLTEIRTALGLPILESLGARFRKNWLPFVAPTIALVALFLGVLYFLIPRWEKRAHDDMVSVVNSQLDSKLKEHHVDDLQVEVGKLQGQMTTMLPFLQMVVQKEMKTLASLPVHDFQDSLTRVNVALAAAKATQADIPTSTIGGLRSKLVQVSRSTPYYWGTATALVGYRSIQLPNNLPNCFDKPPVMTTQQDIPKQMHYPFTLKVTPPTYKDCRIDLSQSPPQEVVDYLKIAPKFGVVEFQQSLVIYKAGTIPLLNITPKLIFTNCAFQISPSNVENEPGRKLVNDLLLAQNPAAITINGKAGE